MRLRWIGLVLGMCVGGLAACSQQAASADEAAIRSLIATYAKAADTADPNLAGSIWATTKGREAQIYQKINGAWRIVHVHYSRMPAAPDRSGA